MPFKKTYEIFDNFYGIIVLNPQISIFTPLNSECLSLSSVIY